MAPASNAPEMIRVIVSIFMAVAFEVRTWLLGSAVLHGFDKRVECAGVYFVRPAPWSRSCRADIEQARQHEAGSKSASGQGLSRVDPI
jgi:hypothetical protein